MFIYFVLMLVLWGDLIYFLFQTLINIIKILNYLVVLTIQYFTFVAFLMVERTEGKQCHTTIDQSNYCETSDCRVKCYAYYNGVGTCFDDPKVPGPSNCDCLYNC